MESVSLFAIDLDHLVDERLAAVVAGFGRYRRIVHASHSDRAGDRCVRVVIPLSRPVAGNRWAAFWRAAVDNLGLPADPKTKAASNLYFLPSRPIDADYYYVDGSGEVLDVNALARGGVLTRAAMAGPASATARGTTTERGDFYSAVADLDQGYALDRISRSALVAGEAITIGPPNARGRRAIIVDGKPTAGFVDAEGRIWHLPTSAGSRNGGPHVAVWCRFYGHTDSTIRRMLIELIPELARFGERRTSRGEPSSRDLWGDR